MKKARRYAIFAIMAGVLFWQGYKDSNLGHAVLETAALPTELHPFESTYIVYNNFT